MVGAARPLSESLVLAKAYGYEPAKCGYDLCRAIILGVREARCNRPDLVLKFGTYLLQHYSSSLSHEVWAAYEQVYISLLQHARYASRRAVPESGTESEEMRLAQEFIATLSAQFPDSMRVKRLEGMMWEAKGDTDQAMILYEEILADDPSNLQVLKRQVAVSRSRGKNADATSKLVKYLEKFCSDPEAWLMLHELYLAHQQYKRAAFAIEELILINPMNYIYHLRAGEITYTLGISERGGSHDQLLTARKYFAHALELKPTHNLRALYGLLLCCAATGSAGKSKAAKERDTAELLAFVQPAIKEEYAAVGSTSMLKLVEGVIEELAIA